MTLSNQQTTEVEEWVRANILPIVRPLGPPAPSYAHCIGLDRFLGGCFHNYISEWAVVPLEPQCIDSIAHLSVTLRAMLVLDDFRRDTAIPQQLASDCIQAHHQLRRIAIRSTCAVVGSSRAAQAMIDESDCVIENAYSALDNGQPPTMSTVLDKCDYIRVPARAAHLVDDLFPLSQFEAFLQYYFFSLQLIDDFFDMQEDYYGQFNHNLFVWNLAKDEADALIDHRPRFVSSVANYIGMNLSKLLDTIAHHAPLSRRLVSETIKLMARWTGGVASGTEGSMNMRGDYEHYVPPASVGDRYARAGLAELCRGAPDRCFDEFRAEIIHARASLASAEWFNGQRTSTADS